MDGQPTAFDIFRMAMIAASMGAASCSVGFGLLLAIDTGSIANASAMLLMVPFALIVSVFTALPIGFGTSWVAIRLFGFGRLQCLMSGYVTASLLLMMLSGWTFPRFDTGEITVTVVVLLSGFIAGEFGYRAQTNTVKYNTDRYP